MTPYEEIEHTADLSIRATGRTLEELFANAAMGMFSLMWDVEGSHDLPLAVPVGLGPADHARLLRLWLTELLFLAETEGIAFGRFEVHFTSEGDIEGTAWGLPASSLPEPPRMAIKAVTYHGLEIRRTDEGFETEIIFDT